MNNNTYNFNSTSGVYSPRLLFEDIYALVARGCKLSYIGRTVLGRKIPCLHIGNDMGSQIIVQAAIHAREHITAALTMRIIDAFLTGGKVCGGIFFVPMVNLDGVALCAEGISSVNSVAHASLLTKVNGGSDFSLWKANARAVDLNVNFDAGYGSGRQNLTYPAPENYIGAFAASEPETQALVSLTQSVKPVCTLSYHCKGQEIYWRFGQDDNRLARDRAIANQLAQITKYKLVSGEGSAGGYKDYCIQHMHIPAFTLEVVSDSFSHPVPYSQLSVEAPPNIKAVAYLDSLGELLKNTSKTIDKAL